MPIPSPNFQFWLLRNIIQEINVGRNLIMDQRTISLLISSEFKQID